MPTKVPNTEAPKTERFNMFISKSEMDEINEWAWENRIRSRSDAVRRLCAIGLVASRDLRAISQSAERVLDVASRQSYAPDPEDLLKAVSALFLAVQANASQLAMYHRDGPFEERQEAADRMRAESEEKAKEAARQLEALSEAKDDDA